MAATSAVSCCPHADIPKTPLPPDPARGALTELVSHLYSCDGMSTYRIGERLGIDRQQVGRLLAAAGVPVKPRGAGRPRLRGGGLDELMVRLYLQSGLSSAQISALTGVAQRTIRDRLRARGVRMRTRGRQNREDRLCPPVGELAQLYVAAGLSAAETGRLLGLSLGIVLRAAHDQGLPVRVGGREPAGGHAHIELIDALYADQEVQRTLRRHGIVQRPAGGTIWQRFPVPLPLSPGLAEELYVCCGVGVRHIELLTGQPAQTVLRFMQAHGIARRPAGGRTPFLRRWAAGHSGGALTPADRR